ncbi:prepilin-type N-terminal cleavage/methylation domain-containing protein [Tumidithrix elongata RA019]|uniref:Prepilin-type N-terminal cleavage/methylation domain-containing protein n=1 Tax=Tumidithrix elongata BACA0141 TaxID=2716417 RepID=A0AAW9Q0P5_9CYAN|nr:prepilin-type N-terminal cleavage/methylation domain-containing protein [Tumidithrix elongata RA019]
MKTTYNLSKCNQPALVCLAKKVSSRQAQKISNQAGFSIVESLVAVVVVSILLAAMAPFLAFTANARVQARRIDQATQAARAYIEGVRAGAIPVPSQFNNAQFNNPATYPNLNVGVLTALPTDPGTLISTDGKPFSTSNPQHFVIQPFRSACITPPSAATCDNTSTGAAAIRVQGYRIGVRVYRADAFNSSTGALGSGSTVVTLLAPVNASTGASYIQSGLSGTLGSQSRPLVVMQSDVTANSVGGSTSTSYTDYVNRFGN